MKWLVVGFLLFLGWASIARYYYVCKIKCLCQQESPFPTPDTAQEKPRPTDPAKQQAGAALLKYSGKNLLPDSTPANKAFLDSLAAALKASPAEFLTIIGIQPFDQPEEPIPGIFLENLGLARAAIIRKLLVETKNIPQQVFLDYYFVPSDMQVAEPILFSLTDNPSGEEMDYPRLPYSFENMTFSSRSFSLTNDGFQAGETFRAYADSVRQYLLQHPNKSLSIIGHSDKEDEHTLQDDPGLRLARTAAMFFVEMKNIKNEVQIFSKGYSMPLHPVEEPYSRPPNKRINIVID